MKNNQVVLYLLEKSFSLSLSNIWRNKVLSLATIFVTGTIIFIFNIILAVNFIANNSLSDLSKKIDVTVYLKDSTEFSDAQNIVTDLNALEGISSVSYTSKEDALNKIKTTHPDIGTAFDKYNLGNPLPASLNISTEDPKYHQAIADFLAQDKYQLYLSNVVTGNSQDNAILTSVSKNLIELSNFSHQIIFWLIMIFIIGGALIILNALQITIFTRKQEINVMKLVGASSWFIRAPFLIESIIYGASAAVLSFIMLFVLSVNIQIDSTSLWDYYAGIDFYLIFLIEFLITILLSIFSATVAIHEYLQKDISEN